MGFNSNFKNILYVATGLIAAVGLYVAYLYLSSDKDFGYTIEWKFWNSSVLWPALSVIGFFLQFIDWQHTSFKEGWVVKDSWGREKFVENNDIMSTLWGSCLFPLLAHFFLIPCIYGAMLYYVIMVPLALVNALIPYLAALLAVAMAGLFYGFARNFEWKSSPLTWLGGAAALSLILLWLLSLPTSSSFNFGSSDKMESAPAMPTAIGHATVTAKVANLRTGPGTEYDFFMQASGEKLQVTKGDNIEIVEDTGEWFKILTATGSTAYIKKTLCTDMEYYQTAEVQAEEIDCYTEEEAEAEEDSNTETTANEPTVVYTSNSTSFYCDGIYKAGEESEAQFFRTNLSGLNRKHFSLSFDFTPENRNEALVLSEGWRVLAIMLNEDNTISITTNNGRHSYSTSIHYSMNERKHIDLEYNDGTLTINGNEMHVDMDEENGDNVLSSWNYSYGGAFKGTLENIVVKSY